MKETGIEWIGSIPDTWNLDRLQWHLDEVKESNSPVQTKQVLSLTNKLGVIPYEEKGEQGNKAKENIDEYKLAYPNTIVANSMNILIGSVGKCNYFGCVSPVYYVFKPKDNENIDFINYIFQTHQFQKELRKYANGILEIRLRVSANDILKREIAYPPIEIQNNIVCLLNEKMNELDALIEIENKQVEELKDYKQKVITEIVTKGLDNTVAYKNSAVDWIGDIPSKWGTPKLKMLCDLSSGGTPSRSHPEYWDGDINWLKTGELQNNEIYDSEEKITELGLNSSSAKEFPIDTILMALYGQGKTRGMTGLLKVKSTTNQACVGITIKNEKKHLIDVKYLWKSLIGAYDGIRKRAVGSGQPNLSGELVSNFEIPLPPLKEQCEIVEHIDKKCKEIDVLISIKQKKIDDLNEYKKSLIYEYVTGKKEVC